MTLTIIIILIITGLVLLVLEVLVIPGSTIVGIIGFAAMIFAIWQAYLVYGSITGHIVLFSTLIITVISLYFMLKSKTWNKLMLNTSLESNPNTRDENLLKTGDEGLAVSRLNPAGKARFGNELYEVHTQGDFVDQNSPVVIIKLDGAKIYVKSK